MLITLVGAGVSGLTTAILLQEHGHRVQVVAAAKGEGTTSSAAGAVWYPFRADPPERVTAWGLRAKGWLTELARTTPEAGVDLLTMYEVVDDDARPWWAACAPDLELVREGIPYPAAMAWRFQVPRVEPALHLAWLESQLRWPIEMRRVVSLDAEPGDLVVNCTGLGARALTGDSQLQALFGQTVVVEPGGIDLATDVVDERDHARMLYVIPRRGSVVIGGCSVPVADDHSLEPNPAFESKSCSAPRQPASRRVASCARSPACVPTVRRSAWNGTGASSTTTGMAGPGSPSRGAARKRSRRWRKNDDFLSRG
ncbi:MAG: FAD-dependent oxidoreductase [Dehalococcoidia bacterium]|nr:FAD-dependent oxidoreductase [Dehalococcoidia bacterium]